MIIFVTFLGFLASSCTALPTLNIVEINPQNVVTVPTNCPDGQQWVNGACREIWSVTAAPANLVTVPTNCPPGQAFVNGQCRDVWIKKLKDESNLRVIQPEDADMFSRNVVSSVPTNCLPGQQWINGYCSDVWRSGTKHFITAPDNCPSGQEFINGQCREVRRLLKNELNTGYRGEEMVDTNRNVIQVPNQCPEGYRPDALGNCRPIFLN